MNERPSVRVRQLFSFTMALYATYRISPKFQKLIQQEKFAELMRLPAIFYFEFRGERTKNVAMTVEQELFRIQQNQLQITRRKSELVYILEDMWLEEQLSQIKAELHILMSRPESERSLEDIDREEELTKLVLSLVDQRDKMLKDLEIERCRSREESLELKQELERKKFIWPNNSNRSPDTAISNTTECIYHSLRELIDQQKLDSKITRLSPVRKVWPVWQSFAEQRKLSRLPQFKAFFGDYAKEHCAIS